MSTSMKPNDILYDDLYELKSGRWVLKPNFPRLSGIGTRAFWNDPIFEYKGFAIKYFVGPREIEMAELAGDCGVKVHGHVVRFDVPPDNQPREVGFVMEIARPLVDYIKTIKDESEKHRIKEEMIAVLEELHTRYNMVHGDVKPLNFVICKDGKIRLCDFECARPVDEKTEVWEFLCHESEITTSTDRYHNKTRYHYVPPTKDDDWYALAISIWELYTGKVPFDTIESGEDMRSHHKTGQTVDLMEVKDDATREWIRRILRKGGASV
ncbi:hypothetical protein TWF730_011197 [Orbilia blumenaviensis]|uniref:non-specific serine/threonine protein kinase n=1 Tax=Orbilia blumenaviensis TaxID=1796055 RepID=A0AAV9UJZ8_9PEZI